MFAILCLELTPQTYRCFYTYQYQNMRVPDLVKGDRIWWYPLMLSLFPSRAWFTSFPPLSYPITMPPPPFCPPLVPPPLVHRIPTCSCGHWSLTGTHRTVQASTPVPPASPHVCDSSHARSMDARPVGIGLLMYTFILLRHIKMHVLLFHSEKSLQSKKFNMDTVNLMCPLKRPECWRQFPNVIDVCHE